jgi:Tfp pilus assembly protein PilF
LASQPDYGPALRTRGQLELYQDRPAEAEIWLRKALAVNPYDYRSHFVLHQSLEFQHKDQEARAEKEQMQLLLDRLERIGAITSKEMAQHPRDAALHLELGKLFLSVGRKEEGVAWLQSALKLNAQLHDAHLALAEYYRSEGNSEEEEYHRRMAGSVEGRSSR